MDLVSRLRHLPATFTAAERALAQADVFGVRLVPVARGSELRRVSRKNRLSDTIAVDPGKRSRSARVRPGSVGLHQQLARLTTDVDPPLPSGGREFVVRRTNGQFQVAGPGN